MNPGAAFHITVNQGLLFTVVGTACLIFVAVSLLYIIEWHRFGIKEREVFVAESAYLIVSVVLLAIAILAATFFTHL